MLGDHEPLEDLSCYMSLFLQQLPSFCFRAPAVKVDRFYGESLQC